MFLTYFEMCKATKEKRLYYFDYEVIRLFLSFLYVNFICNGVRGSPRGILFFWKKGVN